MLAASLAGKLVLIGLIGAAIDIHPNFGAALLVAFTAYGVMRS